jgi:hypothetical protein
LSQARSGAGEGRTIIERGCSSGRFMGFTSHMDLRKGELQITLKISPEITSLV